MIDASAVLWLDFDSSRRNLKSQLHKKIESKTVLQWTLSRIYACKNLKGLVLCYEVGQEEKLATALDCPELASKLLESRAHSEEEVSTAQDQALALAKLNIQGLLPSEIPADFQIRLIPRAKLGQTQKDKLHLQRKGRKWSGECWRGGIQDRYFLDEIFLPKQWQELMHAAKIHYAVSVPSSAVYLQPSLIDEMIEAFDADSVERELYLSTAPPGLAGDILSYSFVRRLSENEQSLRSELGHRIDAPHSDPDRKHAAHYFVEGISTSRTRCLADSSHAYSQILEFSQSKTAAKLNFLKAPKASGELDCALAFTSAWRNFQLDSSSSASAPAPQEIVIEFGDLNSGALSHAASESSQAPIPPIPSLDQFLGLLIEVSKERDDFLFTIGGRYSDPLTDSNFFELVEALKSAEAYGLCLQTPGHLLTDDSITKLLSSSLDVIQVDLFSPSAQVHAMRKNQGPDWKLRHLGLERLLKASAAHREIKSKSPLVVLSLEFDELCSIDYEDFVDSYFHRVDRIVLSPAEDGARSLSEHAFGDFSPPKRFPCVRLENQFRLERNALSGQCPRDYHVGIFKSDQQQQKTEELVHSSTVPIIERWRNTELIELRSQHAAGEWSKNALCKDCVSWSRFD